MDMSAMDSTDQHATQAAHEAMSGSMAADPHLTLTPTRPGTGADTARAAALVLEMRRALERYGDVRSAEADGFRRFLPGVRQPVYHYTSWRSALAPCSWTSRSRRSMPMCARRCGAISATT